MTNSGGPWLSGDWQRREAAGQQKPRSAAISSEIAQPTRPDQAKTQVRITATDQTCVAQRSPNLAMLLQGCFDLDLTFIIDQKRPTRHAEFAPADRKPG